MKAQAKRHLENIKQPLNLIKRRDFANVDAVKNLSVYIQSQCTRMFPYLDSEKDKAQIKTLFKLFDGYETKALQEKQQVIKQAHNILDSQPPLDTVSVAFIEKDHPAQDLNVLKESYKKLLSRVQYAKGVGPVLAEKFFKAKMTSIYDLLHFFPNRYEDRSHIQTIQACTEGDTATLMGTILYAGPTFYKYTKRKTFEVLVEDETGQIRLKWFAFGLQAFNKRFQKGKKIIVSGKVKAFKSEKEIHHPDVELYHGEKESLSFGRVVPVYREIGGIYQKTLRKIMHRLILQYAGSRLALLPVSMSKKYDFIPPSKVLLCLHQPKKMLGTSELSKLQRILSYEEVFFYALAYERQKQLQVQKKTGIAFDQQSEKIPKLIHALPFTLTGAQRKSLEEILQDMSKPFPMNRLLQGDVGSGKTVVAFLAALHAIDNGYQVAFMAPTEILALQHEQTMQVWGEEVGITVQALTGQHTKAQKKTIVENLQNKKINLLVGTHALIQDYVTFDALGLVIIDEQHRFGVRQRDKIRQSSMRPDVLIMSATPIPRSLAMTLFGDVDVSRLNEMPTGRQIIDTRLVQEGEKQTLLDDVKHTVERGEQVFVLCALVEPSPYLDAVDAVQCCADYKKLFPTHTVGLLHGQMKSVEKESVMHMFVSGQIHILVCTTVIEVGIDVPNATLMVIQNPERFGLAQLHQVRGRVGRGAQKGRCILALPKGMSITARNRLKQFSQIHDGFELADLDLKTRGPGDFFGVAQSGLPYFGIAQLPRDLDLLDAARQDVKDLLTQDPDLKAPEHQHLPWVLDNLWQSRIKYVDVA